jgi:arginyl-tRNA synthetase
LKKYEDKIIEILKDKMNLSQVVLEAPKDSTLGDIALPCFYMAKELKKSPIIIANEIKGAIGEVNFIEKIQVVGGYLNFFIDRNTLIKDTLGEIIGKKEIYGSSMTGIGKKALIEHTSINPNASPHVGRARNALIGDALVRLMKFEGYEVETQYFVNDIGKQISMLLLGAKDKKDIVFKDLLDIYIDINKRVEEDPKLEEEVFELLYKVENGDEQVRTNFRRIVEICIEGQTEIFSELGIRYDIFKYESDYIWSGRTNEILEALMSTGKLEEDGDGRLVLNQEEYKLPLKAPYMVLTRQDKTTLYPTRDIAYTIDKVSSGAVKNIVVLGEDQKVYFKQIEAALDLLGYNAPVSVHYSFVLLPEGKMATRKGTVVLLEDLMKESLKVIMNSMKERNESFDEKAAKAIAYGAIKYAFLKVGNDRNVTFDWEQALNFEGDSGPYIQYCYARINSILRKYGKNIPSSTDLSVLKEDAEFDLVKELAFFPRVVEKALNEYSPNVIANYIYGVSKKFSNFYHDYSVLNADCEELKDARILLISSVKQVVKNGLSLLGIDAVEFM